MDSRRISFDTFTLKRLLKEPQPVHKVTGKVLPQVEYWDESYPGFGMRVTSAGRRSWILVGRPKGSTRQERITLGRCADKDGEFGLTLAEARAAASAKQRELRDGRSPNTEKRAAKVAASAAATVVTGKTFGTVKDEFLNRHTRRGGGALRPRTLALYNYILRSHDLEPWADRPIAEITRRDVNAMLDIIQGRGAEIMCTKVLSVVRVLFSWSVQREYLENSPTDHIPKRFEDIPRSRHLFGDDQAGRPSEIGAVWRAAEPLGTYGHVVRFLLMTGARREEAAQLRWDELKLDGPDSRWVLPAERAKNHREHIMPLCSLALEAIAAVPRFQGCPYVFTLDGRKPICMSTDNQTRLEQGMPAGTPHFTHHDLRRTFETGLCSLGVDQDTIDRLMNHTRPGMARIYNHATRAPEKRAAVTRWDRHVRECIASYDASRVRRE